MNDITDIILEFNEFIIKHGIFFLHIFVWWLIGKTSFVKACFRKFTVLFFCNKNPLILGQLIIAYHAKGAVYIIYYIGMVIGYVSTFKDIIYSCKYTLVILIWIFKINAQKNINR